MWLICGIELSIRLIWFHDLPSKTTIVVICVVIVFIMYRRFVSGGKYLNLGSRDYDNLFKNINNSTIVVGYIVFVHVVVFILLWANIVKYN